MLNVKRAVILLVAFASQVIQGMLKLHAHYVSNVCNVSNQTFDLFFTSFLYFARLSTHATHVYIS